MKYLERREVHSSELARQEDKKKDTRHEKMSGILFYLISFELFIFKDRAL